MRKINVALRMSTHPIFQELVDFPPEGVEYIIPKGVTTRGEEGPLKHLKKIAWKALTSIKPPIMNINASGSDLIHSCHGMLIGNNFPWVVDVEHAPSLANYNIRGLMNERYKKAIVKSLLSGNCKRILAWTEAAKASIGSYYGKDAAEKTDVVYPAIREFDFKKPESDSVRFLISSRFFVEKGGLQALEVFSRLRKKYDVELTVLSKVSQEIKSKYTDGITYVEKHFAEEGMWEHMLKKYYAVSDVFLHLTFSDTFGFVFLEAMACGLPVISTNMFSVPEIVENGKNGFCIPSGFSSLDSSYMVKYHRDLGNEKEFYSKIMRLDEKFISEVYEKAALLVEDTAMRKHMGNTGKEMVANGKFSIKTRNKKLREIYDSCL